MSPSLIQVPLYFRTGRMCTEINCIFREIINPMENLRIQNTARFDAKLSKSQKELFENAAKVGGFRTLTEFVITTVQEKANEILEKNKMTIASERDREIFFRTISNPPLPNKKLIAAAKRYRNLVAAK